MKRGLVVAIGGAAIIAAGLVGCSSDKSSTTVSGNGGAVATNSTAKVVIDGKEQKIEGSVACSTVGGKMNIGIGSGAQAIAAVLSDGDSPSVTSVGLGNINGVSLGYTEGAPGGKATVKKDGKKYNISGTATGVDMANPMQPVEKPFEIEVTCP
ncbi:MULTISPECIES: lipoprotein LpqH [Mycobacteroides]|jgi:ipoprotein LpqH|uniref:Lipoprotein LpqH n=1 Tax=Mycobacteroides chelonae TaxID=1774 RepID=A0AB73LTU8_MYCCH|nr:lipoprotein LpqH [Mycobacteroides chelonae]MBF9329345.1 lipoprotein LpqH [Mycobacteroides chelonae]MBF9350694.1 lipoprotein LpqH [Mycobacteroides chelonae]MBF9422873.1 lipoprotein LpqH [Mycobacteroides chelonae]MBF9435060.1 lipoprotein LpqH [Mycobacteroides chelonae]MBV6363157.1 lipoprotein LpqH [Mycobacteroides chelonae]